MKKFLFALKLIREDEKKPDWFFYIVFARTSGDARQVVKLEMAELGDMLIQCRLLDSEPAGGYHE